MSDSSVNTVNVLFCLPVRLFILVKVQMPCPKFVFMCLHMCMFEACVFMRVCAHVCFRENHSGCLLLPSGVGLIPIPALEF